MPAVGVHDDFAPSEPAISFGSSNNELARGIHKQPDSTMVPLTERLRQEFPFHERMDVRLPDSWAMLGGTVPRMWRR